MPMSPVRRSVLVTPAAMKIGDLVIYEGKSYVLRGLEPMSVPDRRAELEDPETGDVVSVPVRLVGEEPPSG